MLYPRQRWPNTVQLRQDDLIPRLDAGYGQTEVESSVIFGEVPSYRRYFVGDSVRDVTPCRPENS